MSPELALKLVAIFEAYFQADEFRELAELFDVSLESLEPYKVQWLAVARELTSKLDHGNTRRLLDSILELADNRNSDGIAHTSWERRDFHQSMVSVLRAAHDILEDAAAPSEITVAAGGIFSAKSRVRELLSTAFVEVFIVDPYVGIGTLDCIRDLSVPIRILTGTHPNSVEPGFDRVIKDFVSEGHQLEVRRSGGLHDRHLIFNSRCWLIGGSLKDAGKKPFHCIEIVDKQLVVSELEAKWHSGAPFP